MSSTDFGHLSKVEAIFNFQRLKFVVTREIWQKVEKVSTLLENILKKDLPSHLDYDFMPS